MGGYRYSSQYSDTSRYHTSNQLGNNNTGKKPMTCFACGKVGHILKQCRSKQFETHKQANTNLSPTEQKTIVYFTCHEVEHKSSQCPKRPRDKVKRVLIPEDKIVHLAANDVMGKIADTSIPMTFDTGAQISLVPIELVKEDEFMGETSKFKGVTTEGSWSEGKVALVTFSVETDRFLSRAVTLLGEIIDWTAVLSVDVSNDDLTAKLVKHIKSKKDWTEAETHYLPPHIKDNSVQCAVLVSEGEVVEKTETSVLELTAHSEEPEVHDCHAEVEVDDVGKSEQVLVEGVGESSVDVAAEGEM